MIYYDFCREHQTLNKIPAEQARTDWIYDKIKPSHLSEMSVIRRRSNKACQNKRWLFTYGITQQEGKNPKKCSLMPKSFFKMKYSFCNLLSARRSKRQCRKLGILTLICKIYLCQTGYSNDKKLSVNIFEKTWIDDIITNIFIQICRQ